MRVANEDDWPPFDFSVGGQPNGISMDYIQLIAARLGVELEFINGFTWAKLQEMAVNKELDILTSIVKTRERQQHFLFTEPYVESPSVIVTLKDNHSIFQLSDLYDKTVAVINGYYIEEHLRNNFPDIKRVYVNNILDGVKAVSYGKVDAFIGSLIVINYEINRALIPNVKIIGESGISDIDATNLRFAVHKDRELLRNILQKAIDTITPEKKIQIQTKWVALPEARDITRKRSLIHLTTQELAWLGAHPKIRVHNERNWPPFNFYEDGTPKGLSIDYMNLLAMRLGIQIEYITDSSWDKLLHMAKNKELDVMLNIVKTDDRQKYLLFTQPYALNPNVIVSRKANRFQTIQELFGKTVAFPKGFFYEEILRKQYPQIKRLAVEDTYESIKAVSIGDADAAVGENAVFNHLIRKNMMTDLTVSGEVKIGDPDIVNLRIGIRDDWKTFHDIMIKAMKSVTDEEMNQLRSKWLLVEDASLNESLALTKEEKAWLKAHEDIRLGVDPAWPPFEFFSATKVYSGIASDYVRILGKDLNVRMKPVPGLSWAEVMDKTREGELDVLPCLVKTPARSKFLLFTRPYLTYGMVILTRDDAPFINGIGDFVSGRVAVVEGYATQELLQRDYPDFKFQVVKDVEEALVAVSKGKIDAFVGNLAAITYKTKELDLKNLKIAATTPYNFELAFGVRKDWPELVKILNKRLMTIPNDKKASINSFWINVRVERKIDWTKVALWVGVVFILASVVIGFVLRWNRRLAHEVYERTRAEAAQREQLAFSNTLIETIPNPLFYKKTNGVYAGCNIAFQDFLQRPRAEIIGKTVYDMVPKQIADKYHQKDQELLNNPGKQEYEWQVQTAKGEIREVIFNKATFTDASDRVAGFIGVITDITDLKKIENELKEAKEAAEAATKVKSDFLANMSHEIRTPMNAILGFLRLTLEDATLPDALRHHLVTAYNSAKMLLGLINDILDLSKLEIGKLVLEERAFSLDHMLEDTLETMSMKALEKKLETAVHLEPELSGNYVGDPFRLRQVIDNLLDNAIKFTEKGSVTLHVSPANKQNRLHFAIADTGIGIPSKALDQIFQPFTQADSSTSRRFGGTGLGTTISRQLVELMGGRIWAESEVGKGSTFHFTVRMKPTRQEVDRLSGEPSLTSFPKTRRCFTILLAEDIEENIALAKIRLEKQGHTVVVVKTGGEAVANFQQGGIDVILMDVQMPDMDGLEATRRIRELEANEDTHIPIIAITASVMKEEQEKCRQAGMDAVIAKPVDFDQLFATLEDIVPEGIGRFVEPADLSSETGNDAQIPKLAGVDTQKGLKNWHVSKAYIEALLNFSRDFGDSHEKLTSLIEKEDLEGVYRIAHALKGVAGNLSVTDVFAVTGQISDAARTGDIGQVRTLLHPLQTALDIALASIKQLEPAKLNKEDPSDTWQPQEFDRHDLKALLDDLLVSFRQYNPKDSAPYLDSLREKLGRKEIEDIERQLSNFNFDLAKTETLALAKRMGIDLEALT